MLLSMLLPPGRQSQSGFVSIVTISNDARAMLCYAMRCDAKGIVSVLPLSMTPSPNQPRYAQKYTKRPSYLYNNAVFRPNARIKTTIFEHPLSRS